MKTNAAKTMALATAVLPLKTRFVAWLAGSFIDHFAIRGRDIVRYDGCSGGVTYTIEVFFLGLHYYGVSELCSHILTGYQIVFFPEVQGCLCGI